MKPKPKPTSPRQRPGQRNFMMRGIPEDLYEQIREVANDRGQTIKAFFLEAARREIERVKGVPE